MGTAKIVNGRTTTKSDARRRGSVRLLVLCLLILWSGSLPVRAAAAEAATAFDQANKLYEQGKFSEAAAAYEALVSSHPPTANVWFNLGNAAYKSGNLGRAIAAYRMAERLTPRDAALRANLQFVRSKVYSDERIRVPLAKTIVRIATVNEWAVLTMALLWASFLVLAWGEWSGNRYIKTSLLLFGATLLLGVLLMAAVKDRAEGNEAIIVADEATARFGALSESQAKFQLRDGAEVDVLDAKGEWLEVRDAEKRVGWVRAAEAMLLPGAPTPNRVKVQ
jgi:hypothetical protein